MILDTCFLLDLLDRDQDAFDKAIELSNSEVDQRIALPTVFEICYGAQYTQDEDEIRKVNNLLLMYNIVIPEQETTEHAAELLANAERTHGTDTGVEKFDALIGAIADKADEPVLTRNIKDFEKLDVCAKNY